MVLSQERSFDTRVNSNPSKNSRSPVELQNGMPNNETIRISPFGEKYRHKPRGWRSMYEDNVHYLSNLITILRTYSIVPPRQLVLGHVQLERETKSWLSLYARRTDVF